MPFTSAGFLFFFLPITIILYYIVNCFGNKKIINLLLILFSVSFYMVSGLRTTIYLIVFIIIIYLSGKIIEYINSKRIKREFFILSLLFIVLTLSYYKYITFILELFQVQKGLFNVIIPLGLSFIMFEAISYLVDIYNLFFSGMNRVMIGFAKKSIIADSLGVVVNDITSNAPLGIDSPTAIFGALCYFLQIYYDFSGYSDIAIGISRMFGFKFKENFNFPYTSLSIGEFWRRWHISLGSWFREYIYIPLGGNRKHVYINLFIVFLITGIWHGSTLNFVIWGIAHGILSMVERLVREKVWYVKIPVIFKWLFTMIFVYLTWVIFMIPSLSEAIVYYKAMIGISSGNIYFTFDYFINKKITLIIFVALLGAFIGKWRKLELIKQWTENSKIGVVVSQVICMLLFILAVLFMMNSSYSPFLYFQF